jgi:hypothetical protein
MLVRSTSLRAQVPLHSVPNFPVESGMYIRNLSQGVRIQSKINRLAGHQWLTPVILATQKAEIRRIEVQGHPK